jgi:hypothetical protein
MIEKRFEQVKTVHEIAPVFLKQADKEKAIRNPKHRGFASAWKRAVASGKPAILHCLIVAAGRHAIPDPIQIRFQIRLEIRHRLPVHARRPTVGLHTI